MRITDILFFGLLFICLTILCISLITGFDIPIVILKIFFPKHKTTQWIEKERW
jgi:hypothetical protein